MSGGLEVLIFVVSSMAVSCLVGWRIGKTGSRKLNRLRLRAVLISVALFFTIVPLALVSVSLVLARGVDSLDYFLSMWAVSIFIVLVSITSGSVGVWVILGLSLLFCLATLSISRRRSGNSDMFLEHNLVRMAQQEEFLWNVEETIARQKERQ